MAFRKNETVADRLQRFNSWSVWSFKTTPTQALEVTLNKTHIEPHLKELAMKSDVGLTSLGPGRGYRGMEDVSLKPDSDFLQKAKNVVLKVQAELY